MFRSGFPQRRQSHGNSVANKAAATPCTPETKEENNELSVGAIALPDRLGMLPLLLKTTLPRPAVATGAPAERISLSIAVLKSACNQ